MVTRYVGSFTTALRDDADHRLSTLIWGDALHVVESSGDRVRVRARGLEGWVDASSVSTRSLLELYVIDVGQGDGMLLKTPGGAWHLIDAGMASRDQMTKKGATNFVRWKFIRDLGRDKVSLDSVVVTHNDYDHYGGLLDLLSGRLFDGRTFDVEVGRLYHDGLGRFLGAPTLGASEEAEVDPFPQGDHGLRRRANSPPSCWTTRTPSPTLPESSRNASGNTLPWPARSPGRSAASPISTGSCPATPPARTTSRSGSWARSWSGSPRIGGGFGAWGATRRR